MKTFSRALLWMLPAALALAISGCRSGGQYHVVVGNVGAHALEDVTVALEDYDPFRVEDTLPVQGEHYFSPLDAPPTGEARVSWVSPDGQTLSRQVFFDKRFGEKARYRIYFQIEPDQTVSLFVDKIAKRSGSSMPWGKPANWEGTVAIPGLTTEEE